MKSSLVTFTKSDSSLEYPFSQGFWYIRSSCNCMVTVQVTLTEVISIRSIIEIPAALSIMGLRHIVNAILIYVIEIIETCARRAKEQL